jgi:hypothetical protein
MQMYRSYEGHVMPQHVSERRLIIRSRMAEGFALSEAGLKNLQHVLTDWLPRSVYFDLTDDAARVDVEVRKSFTGKFAFTVSFVRSNASIIKKVEYLEEGMLGKVCKPFNRQRTRYDGKHDGYDHRLVIYIPDEPSLDKTLRIARG